jgi:hypothetical protein
VSATRNFRLDCTGSVLMPRTFGARLGVIAGEACTELGFDTMRTPRRSWLERVFGFGSSARRPRSKEEHGTDS